MTYTPIAPTSFNPHRANSVNFILTDQTMDLNTIQSLALESIVESALANHEDLGIQDYENDYVGGYGVGMLASACKAHILALESYLSKRFVSAENLYNYYTDKPDSGLSLERLKGIDNVETEYLKGYTLLEMIRDLCEQDNFNYLMISEMSGSGVGLWEILPSDYKPATRLD